MSPTFPSMDPDKTYLVTGAAGFIGFHLADFLASRGARVVGFDNLNDYYDVRLKEARLDLLNALPTFRFLQGDLADGEAVDRLFAENRPEIVIHLAAQAGVRYSIENPRAYIDSNLVGFFHLLEGCRRYPTEHLVYASSSSVYGNQSKTPFSTDDRTDEPVSLYAATKKSNELLAYSYSHLYGIPSTGLRFFTVYGPYGRPDMAAFLFTRKIFNDEPIQVFRHGEMFRDFTYIDDIVRGVVSILGTPPAPNEKGVRSKIYNIGNSKPEKLTDFIETLERIIGKKARKEFLPTQPGDVYQTFADISDLTRDFGFKPETPIAIGLARFVEWYREFYHL